MHSQGPFSKHPGYLWQVIITCSLYRISERHGAGLPCTWIPRGSAQWNIAKPERTRRRPPQPRLPCDPSKNVQARLALSLQRVTDSRLTKQQVVSRLRSCSDVHTAANLFRIA